MEPIKNLTSHIRLPAKKDPKLHSEAHVLADELATKLGDPKHFGFYLKLATTQSHAVLRQICGNVLDSREVKNKGKLFAYLIKQYNAQSKE